MLVKQGSLVKQAFFGAIGSMLGKGALGLAKGTAKGIWGTGKMIYKHPVGALNTGGMLYSTGAAASSGMKAMDEMAHTAYRYF